MAKLAYYFTHDSNASQDPKILQMCSVYKAEGYGWYWMLIEQMRDQADYKLPISGKYAIDAFASRFYADAKILQNFIDDCVKEFHLFSRDKDFLWSESLLRRMKMYDEKSEKARESALKRWKPQPQNNANALLTHDINNANASKNDAIRTDKNIYKNRTDKNIVIAPKKPYGEFQNVLLTDEEVSKLKEKFNDQFIEKIEALSEYLKSKGKKYDSHYATILTWARNDEKDGGNNHAKQSFTPRTYAANQRRITQHLPEDYERSARENNVN